MNKALKGKTIQKIAAAKKAAGIIALVAVIGFTMTACGEPGGSSGGNSSGDGGSGKYAGSDVIGNAYSLSVGSDATRAAAKGDRYSMDVKTKDGTTRTSKGVITNVSTDGTLTLQPDGGGDAFLAVYNNGVLTSVASAGSDDVAKITFDNGSQFIPRTFENIHLRATRWGEPDGDHGEHWGSGFSILVKDFPTNVINFTETAERYFLTLGGTADKDLDHVAVEIQGIKNDDSWFYLGGCDIEAIKANKPFYEKAEVKWPRNAAFSDFKEVVIQITNGFNYYSVENPEWNTNYGSIPANIPNGQIMSTIGNFKIALRDREEVGGNVGAFEYGIDEDGNYTQARWILSKGNTTNAQKTGAKFVLVLTTTPTGAMHFAWESLEKDSWWNATLILENNAFKDGASWNSSTKTLTIDLPTALQNYENFKTVTQANLLIAYYGSSDIDDLGIVSANITTP